MQALVDYSGSDSDSDSDGRRRSSSDSSRDSLEHAGEKDTAKKYPHTAAASTSTGGGKKDIGLISAADLFAAEVDTVYLKKPKAEFEVQPTEQEQKPVARPKQPAVIARSAVSSRGAAASAASAAQGKHGKKEIAGGAKHNTNNGKRGNVTEDLTAKDKIKRQRLSGQSGLGSDFKEWRSEEEMRQRQMFD